MSGEAGGGAAEEASRLFSQAKRALSRGALAEASELADEAARLLPGQRQLAELQAAIAAARSGGGASAPPPPPTAPRGSDGGAPRPQPAAADSPRARQATPPRARPASSGDTTPRAAPHQPGGASDEQKALVARVLRAGDDPYSVLGVARGASEEDAKRAYKKLALKLHPDKCKIPHAELAFKSVSRAFSCLSDPDKRANFDRFGSEDGAAGLRRRQHAGPYGGDEMDADALFRAFFGGGGFGQGVHFSYAGPGGFRPAHAHRRAQRPPPPPDTFWGLLRQLQPLLLIFFFLVVPQLLPQPREPAVLRRSAEHPVAMRTARRDLPYYVATSPSFEEAYPPESYARRRLESELEQSHAERLVRSCQDDTTRARWQATRRGQPLPQFAGPACAELHERYADMMAPSNHARSSWGY